MITKSVATLLIVMGAIPCAGVCWALSKEKYNHRVTSLGVLVAIAAALITAVGNFDGRPSEAAVPQPRDPDQLKHLGEARAMIKEINSEVTTLQAGIADDRNLIAANQDRLLHGLGDAAALREEIGSLEARDDLSSSRIGKLQAAAENLNKKIDALTAS